MKILGTGLSGMVGSRVVELLSPSFQFENLSLETGVDITKKETVDQYIASSDAPWIFHFAARTDVDGAEKERTLKEKSPTWIVNVLATQYIIDACKRTGKKLLYISTDFVFDGTRDEYREEDLPNPLSWYAITKYEGERRVSSLRDHGLIVRIANPYRIDTFAKPDFVHKIIDRLKNHQEVVAANDQIFVPTFIDDIARALNILVENNASGVYHVVGGQALSPFAAAQKIAAVFGLDLSLVKSTTFAEYFAGRAPRPFHAHLKNDKITQLGVVMHSFDEVLPHIKV